MLRALIPALVFCYSINRIPAGEIYYTGFDNFVPGNDTIAGTDGWTGSSSHAGRALSGVDAESDHLVSGIGNAAFIGGNDTLLPSSVSRTVNVRRAFNLDPLALGQEVARFHVNFGIKDSTYNGLATRRDNFEFSFYNSAGQIIAFIQFDNTTLDSGTQAPAQKIWRSNFSGGSLGKTDTGGFFYYDNLMELQVRINFRTNRWTASLDDLDLFADQPFYTGPNARNLGTIAAQMYIYNPVSVSPPALAPGTNYMLFDNFALRLDPVPDPVIYSATIDSGGAPRLTWLTEALYRYQVQYTDDLKLAWKNDLPGSATTATATGVSAAFTDTTAAGKAKRYYRVVRSLP